MVMMPAAAVETPKIDPARAQAEYDFAVIADEESVGLPSEAELVLLCLDYLRDVRRSCGADALRTNEGLDADYLTAAVWALNRAFLSPPHLTAAAGNDAWSDMHAGSLGSITVHGKGRKPSSFPDLATMERELLWQEQEAEKKDDDDDNIYEYDDTAASNSHRFYPLAGLASGPGLEGPLTLPEVVAAGLAGLGARSRLEAERDMIRSALFEQFLSAVRSKGFFDDPEGDAPPCENSNNNDPTAEEKRRVRRQQVYNERYRKVVAKFRNKLATKADSVTTGDLLAFSVADQVRKRRAERKTMTTPNEHERPSAIPSTIADLPVPEIYLQQRTNVASKFSFGTTPDHKEEAETVLSGHHPDDVDEAEKLKAQGNTHMQKKEYQQACDCYTQALKLSPAGPHSHVYFSNRAAALVSMKKFEDAIADSERSLALKPDYGKAHARLGLAHFLLGNYRAALEAYTVALKYEPDNKSSKNYLEKAAKRLAEQEDKAAMAGPASFSVVSEWDKSRKQQAGQTEDEREAEKAKVKGNQLMAAREYQQACDCYSAAIQLSSTGPHSHVYYSNRAAALCYLERYQEAEADSLQSLRLNPAYGKAHARLGLSRFFLKDYAGAVEAYSAALEFDPDNAASKSYLAKAQAKLAETEQT
jgi:tetratricopeptide (TPR) repeat protein